MNPVTRSLTRGARLAGAAIALSFAARTAAGQGADSTCGYERCALNIMPRLLALDVIRGSAEARVSSLGFLFPRRVTTLFVGSEPAQRHADHAFALRRVAAVLTDVGVVVAASAGTRALAASSHREGATAAAIAGVAMVASSVPIHFAADGELSRAVWEYNRRFSR